MKKTKVLVLLIAILLCLSGCSAIDNAIGEKMLERSGVLNYEDYKKYQKEKEQGNVDGENYYQEPSVDVNLGTVGVSLAKNSNLDIQYYMDSTKNNCISNNYFYVSPGDAIYADVAVSSSVTSSMYEFASFHLIGIDDNGKRYLLSEVKSNDMLCAEIPVPSDYKGTQLVIEPIGQYCKRRITLDDYFKDNNDRKFELDGTWYVNDEKVTSDFVEINPTSSYTVSYEYDNEEYFFSTSEPECYPIKDTGGIVVFSQRESTDTTENYSVELRKYLTVSLNSNVERTVKVNNGDMVNIEQNKDLEISHLKYGDKVLIETNKEWSDLEKSRNLILINTEPLSTGSYKYSLIVPEKDGQFVFDPNEYEYEHGTLAFRCFGEEVKGVQYLAKGSKIYYKELTADDGYWLASGENYVEVGDEEETKKQLSAIQFTKKELVNVNLKQPKYGGTIIYSQNGSKVSKDSVQAYSGDVFSLNFEPWDGWYCSPHKDGETFSVPADKQYVTVTIDNEDVDDIFKEDESHKPLLSVVIEKSVGQDAKFEIEASGLEKKTYSYTDKWYRNEDKIIDKQLVGTEKPISLKIQKTSLPPNKAFKIVIKKGESIDDIRYIDDLTRAEDPIYIYNPGIEVDPKEWYKTVEIIVSLEDVQSFSAPPSMENATIEIKNADTRRTIRSGDKIQESQNIIVAIKPKKGFYIEGGNVSDKTVYQDTLKYSKYLSKIDAIISEHIARKICTVNLGTKDDFATYSYKYDGEIVTGTIQIKEGQKLSLDYEINDLQHSMKEKSGGFLGIGKSDKKTSKSIVITSEHDGSTIDRSSFGIDIIGGN